jgi:hypothetical protein
MKQSIYFFVMVLWLMNCHAVAATPKEELLNQSLEWNKKSTVYFQQGKYPQALNALQESLIIREKVWAKHHPSVASGYHNMAFI